MSAQKGMHPEQIKAQVRMRGKTLAQLARDHEVSQSAVTKALREPCTVGEKIIANFLGFPLHSLWPERWTVCGQRIRPRYAYKYNKN